MRIMAFSPHPDDIEFLCGGTLAKYQSQGHTIGMAVMTRGDVGSPTLSREEIARIREGEARDAAELIGAEFFWLGFDDEFLYDAPETRRQVIDVIRQFRPDIVLCPDRENDYHPDHVRTGQIIWDTHVMGTVPLIPTGHPVCEKIHEIFYYDTIAGLHFTPDTYVDIGDFWEIKSQMIGCHKSQNIWNEHMYGISTLDNAMAQSRFRGFQVGCLYAEAFRKARKFPQGVVKGGLL